MALQPEGSHPWTSRQSSNSIASRISIIIQCMQYIFTKLLLFFGNGNVCVKTDPKKPARELDQNQNKKILFI